MEKSCHQERIINHTSLWTCQIIQASPGSELRHWTSDHPHVSIVGLFPERVCGCAKHQSPLDIAWACFWGKMTHKLVLGQGCTRYGSPLHSAPPLPCGLPTTSFSCSESIGLTRLQHSPRIISDTCSWRMSCPRAVEAANEAQRNPRANCMGKARPYCLVWRSTCFLFNNPCPLFIK